MSGFTALNGTSPKVAAKPALPSSSPTSRNGAVKEQSSVVTAAPVSPPAAPIAEATLAPEPAPVQTPPDMPEPVPALVDTPAPAQAPVDVSAPAPAQASDIPSPKQRESWPTKGLERSTSTAGHPEQEASNKRKRSASHEGRSPLPTQPAKRVQHQPRERTQEPTPETVVIASPPPSGGFRNGESQDKEKEVWYAQSEPDVDHHSQTYSTASPYPGHSGSAPAPAAIEQPGAQRQPPGQIEYVPVTPQGSSRAVIQCQNASYSEPRASAVVQHDPKKRKRNFSNRTKTGCLTCRRRKKKCDEAKPECNNCIKGAFVCAGYPPQRGAGWPKITDSKAGGVPLESKDPNYVPPAGYAVPASPYTSAQAAHALNNGQPSHPPPLGQGLKREPLPQYRGQNLRIEPPKGAARDDRGPPSAAPSGTAASPEHKLPPGPFTPGNPYPTPVSANTQPPAFGDRAGSDYQRTHHEHMGQVTLHSPTPVSSAQMAAQMALSHAQSHPPSQSHAAVVPYDQRRPTQKEEMLAGGYYYQYDKELSMERDRAAAACWRFNTFTLPPTNGVSVEERARLFLEIIQPRESAFLPPEEASARSNVGRVGRHVAVEAPFYCDYGYNMSIGNNVVIGRNCTFNDAGKIQIGDNSIIGPNVNIYTVELSTDPKHRQGGQGAQLGKGVIIDSDCWIGGNAIIMPGKVIGKGSTVGAGSVVTKDVPPFTVVAGNPARVLRGVASL